MSAAATGAPGAASSAPIAFATCATRAPVQCGTLTVPLDRANPGAGALVLHVERIRATRPRRGTLVLLAGGPGQAGTPISPDDPLAAAIPGYDVVMLDQRGTGRGALRCRALDARGAAHTADAVGRCAQELGPNRAFYTSRDSVLDLDDLRSGLGLDAFALGGISYGTYVAQYYAQQFPTRVTHLVLDSVVDPATFDGMDLPFLQSATPVLTGLCGTGRCRGITPDPVGDIAALVQATSARALRGLRPTASGRLVRSAVGGPGHQDEIPGLLATGDLDSTVRAMWPGAARAARAGDAGPLLRLATIQSSGDAPPPAEISSALYFATMCADSALPWSSATSITDRQGLLAARAQAIGAAAYAPFGVEVGRASAVASSCRLWPEAAVDPLQPGPLPPVPTLLLDGGQDMRTPVSSARAVAARSSSASLVIAPGAGHSLLYSYSCAQRQVRNLLDARPVPATACNREAPVPQAVRVPPADLGQVAPAGAPGTAGRVARAARLTVQDGVLSIGAASAAGMDALPGIRGGTARQLGTLGATITYSRFSAVRGVRISGTLAFNGSTFQGALDVNGPGAWDGTLYLARGGQRAYTGSIGGVSVRIPLG